VTPADRKRRAEALVRLSEMSEGKLFMEELAAEYDTAMKTLLFAKPDEIIAAQGRAQAYHNALKKFTDARKELGG
jgi:hypothetical protein